MPPIRFVASSSETRALDETLVRELDLSEDELMEIAGAGCFLLLRPLAESAARVVVAAGPGKNGGDGFVVARYAAASGIPTSVFVMSPIAEGKPSRRQLDRLARYAIPTAAGDLAGLERALADPGVLAVDALFGTGIKEPLTPDSVAWIHALNRAPGNVVSIDLPSGMDGDTGSTSSGCVRAAFTLTIGTIKSGLLSTHGSAAAGNVYVVPLPYPPAHTRDLRRLNS